MLRQENINVFLKWPNDIFIDSKKLIGFLPRVITRGKKIIYVRVGLGMNVLNTLHQRVFHYQKYFKLRILINIFGQPKFLKLYMIQLNAITKKNM